MQLRRANMADMYEMQNCNLRCLPENYNLRYYLYHILSWPQVLYVQEDYNGKTAGYVLGKLDDEETKDKIHGHITSLAVLRSHRKMGIASRVMHASMIEMDREYGGKYCSLHVRKTNDAALHLYQDTLGFRCAGVEHKYYADDEDAFHMKHYFHQDNPGTYVTEERQFVHKPVPSAGATANESEDLSAERRKDGKTGKKEKPSSKELESAMAELLDELGETGSGTKSKGKSAHKQPPPKKGKK